MNTTVNICPMCEANYPPRTFSLIEKYGKCLFCDTPMVALLGKSVPKDSQILKENLPQFPQYRIDLDQYDVNLPFLDQYMDILFVPEADRKKFSYIVKLELIRAQILTELSKPH